MGSADCAPRLKRYDNTKQERFTTFKATQGHQQDRRHYSAGLESYHTQSSMSRNGIINKKVATTTSGIMLRRRRKRMKQRLDSEEVTVKRQSHERAKKAGEPVGGLDGNDSDVNENI